ncbi:K02A2.6-like [Cordylochernes scorpioides]|uniref:K02A2.6-like n=1 Tax=Cordylochernes scorpioides TaxID=51811 RepID=A0ABY6L910_9ARAC|nr:K02A2.6-like [Cordylochernes scorpioides]
MINENVPIHQKIQKILLRYRATPLASGRSPSEMYLNRQIRIKLDAMRPYQEERSQQQIQPRTRCLQVGERVQARVFISNKPFWKNGTIKQKLGNLHYVIELDEGKSLKRHINQL